MVIHYSISQYDWYNPERKEITPLEESHKMEMIYESHYSDLNEILHEALERLPEQQKSVVLFRDYEGYSYKEIGEIMD